MLQKERVCLPAYDPDRRCQLLHPVRPERQGYATKDQNTEGPQTGTIHSETERLHCTQQKNRRHRSGEMRLDILRGRIEQGRQEVPVQPRQTAKRNEKEKVCQNKDGIEIETR